MFRCPLCGHVAAPRTKAVRVVLEIRPRTYPRRARANVVRRVDARARVREYEIDDPGGRGTEIVREILACAACAARPHEPASVSWTRDDLPRRRAQSLARRGLTEVEYDLLVTVGYAVFLSPKGLASVACDEATAPDNHPSLVEYERALERLIGTKRALRVLDQRDCDAERDRLRAWPGPKLVEDDEWRPGDVVFTASGFALYRNVLSETFGRDHIQPRSGWLVDDERGTAQIVADTRAECRRCAQQLRQELEEDTYDPVRVIGLSEVQECGRWLPSHFETLEAGWSATLRFERIDVHSDADESA